MKSVFIWRKGNTLSISPILIIESFRRVKFNSKSTELLYMYTCLCHSYHAEVACAQTLIHNVQMYRCYNDSYA